MDPAADNGAHISIICQERMENVLRARDVLGSCDLNDDDSADA